MKKKNIRLLLLLNLLLCFTGCATTEQAGEESPGTPAPTMSISDIFQPEATSGVVDMGSSNVLSEELERVETTDRADYNAANRMLKHIAEQSQDSLFCIDGDTGVVYFVNQKQDYYIYRLKDGVAELAVPIPAKELYCQNGVLYFMVEDYDRYELQGMKEWDIYAYHPAEGTVEPVYAVGELMENVDESIEFFQKMTVDENGIYFLGNIEKKTVEANGIAYKVIEMESCCLPFGATEPVTDNRNMTNAGWGDYYFSYGETMCVSLLHRETRATKDTIIVSGNAYNYCCIEDEVYLLEGQKIIKVNLITKERTEYDCDPVIRKNDNRFTGDTSLPDLITFTLTEDSIWAFNSANYIVRFDRHSGESSCYKLGATIAGETVYTDGQSVYILTLTGVARILTEEADESVNGVSSLAAELLVK